MKQKEKNIEERIKKTKKELKKARIELSNLKLEEISIGDLVHYSGFDWYVIAKNEEKTTLFMKEQLQPEIIKKYFAMPGMVDDDYHVKFSDFNDNHWENSYIRHVLNSQFLKDHFNRDELVQENNDYVSLITKEEVEKLPEKIRKSENSEYGYWTKSSLSYCSNNVYRVNTAGRVCCYSVCLTHGVRPVITVKSNIQLKSTEGESFDRKNQL